LSISDFDQALEEVVPEDISQSLLKITIPLSVQRSQMMVFCRMTLLGKR
jgi:hypothetical protein